VAERLAEWALRGLTPALDWRLFGLRGRPWGERPAAIALDGRRIALSNQWEESTLDAWL